ncbi:phosphomethylpyrimidine kinase [Desulfonatronospira thiodismutans ASO3-1]|uniref:hydroxymethylpyrimidine kinase n=1 Tax=Desulfonatronospira thiodismutans ASO3-1 TaxID=555779 RepID=D6SS35_9BACT|nr:MULTISPECIES: bifunctional hydroxymethylpyrimidine kinase/phosphomethylpyrimidine kinase [Desulfonatronospira]EFI33501.1 phosphomethylpyrimidine kinase [Desulfonatronospira thiodismutans ASO3-1]RQD74141.1 MAG: bifunctional hydroxymethylpyrimidine kinase/phosphomethylpyrimidine kinase [Desulfonatronospira sp. MSAO_Bac3]
MTSPLPCTLTIAGSDPGGGAGIQADLKTFSMHRVYGLSVITALTAQNTTGVQGVFAPEPDFVALQLQSVLDDFPVRAAKTGMLFSADIISAVAGALKGADFPLVVDPVCVSQSGHKLLQDEAVQALKDKILPLSALITPNRPEAELLTGMHRISSRDDILKAIVRLQDMGAEGVLLKGGHFSPTHDITDWLGIRGQEPLAITKARVNTTSNHGTGCTLSAAIAANLALGMDMQAAVVKGRDYLQLALEKSFPLGRGHGPVNHLAALS